MSPPKSADGSKRSIAFKSCCSWRHGLNPIQEITVFFSSGTYTVGVDQVQGNDV